MQSDQNTITAFWDLLNNFLGNNVIYFSSVYTIKQNIATINFVLTTITNSFQKTRLIYLLLAHD